jgi:hypothetical protein
LALSVAMALLPALVMWCCGALFGGSAELPG